MSRTLQILAGVSIALGACITAASFSGLLLDPLKRIVMLSLITIILGVTCVISKKEEKKRDIGFGATENNSHTRNLIRPATLWGILFFFTATVLVVDLSINFSGIVAVADVEGPFFPEGEYLALHQASPESHPEDSRHDLPTDNAGFSDSRLSSLYEGHLGEHFAFDIKKNPHFEYVKIEDVIIKVHDYKKLPPNITIAKGVGEFSQNCIIAVKLDAVEKKDLPKSFHAKWLLDDFENLKPTEWNRKQVILERNIPQIFFVKIFASVPGDYTYTAELVLKNSLTSQTVKLFKAKRTVRFLPSGEPPESAPLPEERPPAPPAPAPMPAPPV